MKNKKILSAMKQRYVMFAIFFSLLATMPVWSQTQIIRRIPVEVKSQKSSQLARKIAGCKYVTYQNKGYGYTFKYPDFMVKYVDKMGMDDDSKGIVLSWNNQVAINSWVDEAGGDTPQTLWNTLKENKDIRYTYHRIIGNTLFSSGYMPNGNILYDKWVFKDGLIYSVSLEYPVGNKKDMDDVVKKVAASLKTL